MAGRPSAPCHLIKGMLVDVATGFVDTFNWLADTLFSLKAGDGLKIDWQSPSNPVIRIDDEVLKQLKGAKIKITGTDGSSHEDKEFSVVAGDYTNLTSSVDASGNVKIGVYYS